MAGGTFCQFEAADLETLRGGVADDDGVVVTAAQECLSVFVCFFSHSREAWSLRGKSVQESNETHCSR